MIFQQFPCHDLPWYGIGRPFGVPIASGVRVSGDSHRAICQNRFDHAGAPIDNRPNVDILYPVESVIWIFCIQFVSLIISKKNEPHNIVIQIRMDFSGFKRIKRNAPSGLASSLLFRDGYNLGIPWEGRKKSEQKPVKRTCYEIITIDRQEQKTGDSNDGNRNAHDSGPGIFFPVRHGG
ncbi:MAG: hypothetical protein C4522_05950 [Desulfobacteraceae bacterium]|nr:MAG: hypothetical protein C4522_05950 [Desulfobacteraceae bacterium]